MHFLAIFFTALKYPLSRIMNKCENFSTAIPFYLISRDSLMTDMVVAHFLCVCVLGMGLTSMMFVEKTVQRTLKFGSDGLISQYVKVIYNKNKQGSI